MFLETAPATCAKVEEAAMVLRAASSANGEEEGTGWVVRSVGTA